LNAEANRADLFVANEVTLKVRPLDLFSQPGAVVTDVATMNDEVRVPERIE